MRKNTYCVTRRSTRGSYHLGGLFLSADSCGYTGVMHVELRPGQSVVLGFLGGLALGMLVMWGWYRLDNAPASETDQPVTTATPETEGLPTGDESGLLTIYDQPAGFAVVVARAAVSDPTWVAIYEDVGGQPGNVLGAGRFTSDKMSGTVHLLRGTLPGNRYYGVLHRDDGDRLFSLERDFPVRDENGDPIMVTFVTQ